MGTIEINGNEYPANIFRMKRVPNNITTFQNAIVDLRAEMEEHDGDSERGQAEIAAIEAKITRLEAKLVYIQEQLGPPAEEPSQAGNASQAVPNPNDDEDDEEENGSDSADGTPRGVPDSADEAKGDPAAGGAAAAEEKADDDAEEKADDDAAAAAAAAAAAGGAANPADPAAAVRAPHVPPPSIVSGSGHAALAKVDDTGPTDSGVAPPETGSGGLSNKAGENADVGLSGNRAQAQVNAATVQSKVKDAVHPIAVKRIAAKKGLNYTMMRDAYVKAHRSEMMQMSNDDIYATNKDLCEQNPEMRIKEPRYMTGRVNMLREYVELQVLSVMAEPSPEDIASDSRMGLLLDASKLGMSLSDLSEALKRGAPAAAAPVVAAAAAAAAGGATGGAAAPAAGVAATEALRVEIEKRKAEKAGVVSQNASLKGTGPADLTVLRYGDFASTTIPGERVPQDANYLMDRRLFDQNFSSDAPITDSTFFFHLPKKEKKEIVRF